MRTALRLAAALSVAALAPLCAQTQAGQAASAPATPAVGITAPDFTAAWADSTGTRATPVALASLRGKVVVLAFYPKDRTGGCTYELSKFRDEYATMFGNDVVVLPISSDTLAEHTAWSKDMHFPFALVSDPTGAVASKYGAAVAGRATFSRSIYVIAKDGKISYAEPKFNALAQDGYDKLVAEIKRARGT